MKPKAVVAMSGGVDSSVAAALMKEEGYDVTGIMMKLWKGEAANNESGCCSLDAAEDARRVAQVLDIPFYVFNFAGRFEVNVINRFRAEYARGRTPNPCVECNRSIKFDALMERTRAFDANILATGHYARVKSNSGSFSLHAGTDPSKDQSYVLYMLSQSDLSHSLFPVGEYRKPEIRKIASELGLRTANKAESQEICFVPHGDTRAFLDSELPQGSQPGDVVDLQGNIIGTHRGYAHYTVGQRRGVGVGLGFPVYVRSVLAESNVVQVATKEAMKMRTMDLEDCSFTNDDRPEALRVEVMTRYRGPLSGAAIQRTHSGYKVVFDEEQSPAAPGQAAVFYDGDQVLGGGTIA
ncbi:MAG: tRNA 2-thiouridine(34) synthase MnmA, partial [Actinomycetota bacterium]